ncbi:MAG: hypothetical protein NXY57DRAFT_1042387, partial [Lentinula lateritia]
MSNNQPTNYPRTRKATALQNTGARDVTVSSSQVPSSAQRERASRRNEPSRSAHIPSTEEVPSRLSEGTINLPTSVGTGGPALISAPGQIDPTMLAPSMQGFPLPTGTNPERPATPLRIHHVSDSVTYFATPSSHHSGSYTGALPVDEPHTVEEAYRYLQMDLEAVRILPVEKWALCCLNIDINKGREKLLPGVEKAFDKYLEIVDDAKNEKDPRLYPALVATFDLCTNGDSDTLVFYRQDPSKIAGSLVLESPDIGAVFKELLEDPNKVKRKNLELKEGERTMWAHTHGFIEVKHQHGVIVDGEFGRDAGKIYRMKKDQEQAKVTSNKSKVNKNTNKRDRDDSDVDEDINKPVSKTRRSNTPVQSTSNSRVPSQHTFEDDPKRTKEGLAKRARQQLGGYARDALSFGFPRSHFILFIVDSKLVRGIFYDRSAIVESGILDLRKSKDRLIFSKMIQQLRGLSPEALGMVPGFNTSFMKDPTTLQYPGPANDKGYPSSGIFEFKEGSSFTFPYGKKGTRTVKVGRVLFRSNGVLGRGPIVMQVTCVCKGSSRCDWCGKKLALKLSCPSKTRASEKAFMDKCKEKATGEHAWVLNHLPEIYYSFDIEFSAESPQAQLKEIFGEEYEMRVVRGIILEELHPLSTLKTERECAQVFYDIVQCHHWAWKYPQILHRDISEGNIMVREKNGQKYGVLNDWDLASWLSTQNEV